MKQIVIRTWMSAVAVLVFFGINLTQQLGAAAYTNPKNFQALVTIIKEKTNDVRYKSRLEMAVQQLKSDSGDDLFMIDEFPGDTPLTLSAKENNTSAISVFLEQGADINGQNKQGQTPLLCAIAFDNYDAAAMLLSAGADPNLGDSCGQVPLALAISRYSYLEDTKLKENRKQIIELLLEKKARMNPSGITQILQQRVNAGQAKMGDAEFLELLALIEENSNHDLSFNSKLNELLLELKNNKKLTTAVREQPNAPISGNYNEAHPEYNPATIAKTVTAHVLKLDRQAREKKEAQGAIRKGRVREIIAQFNKMDLENERQGPRRIKQERNRQENIEREREKLAHNKSEKPSRQEEARLHHLTFTAILQLQTIVKHLAETVDAAIKPTISATTRSVNTPSPLPFCYVPPLPASSPGTKVGSRLPVSPTKKNKPEQPAGLNNGMLEKIPKNQFNLKPVTPQQQNNSQNQNHKMENLMESLKDLLDNRRRNSEKEDTTEEDTTEEWND